MRWGEFSWFFCPQCRKITISRFSSSQSRKHPLMSASSRLDSFLLTRIQICSISEDLRQFYNRPSCFRSTVVWRLNLNTEGNINCKNFGYTKRNIDAGFGQLCLPSAFHMWSKLYGVGSRHIETHFWQSCTLDTELNLHLMRLDRCLSD